MNYYECLEIEKTATPLEIKKAYFRLVKKYTPEKNPDKFMEIRKAYEVLSDPKKRNEHTNILNKYSGESNEITSLIMEAVSLKERNLHSDAVILLNKSKFIKKKSVQVLLAEIYMDANKTGQATKIAEKLVENNPKDPDCYRLLVKVYTKRGWTNKSSDVLAALLKIEPNNEWNILATYPEDEYDLYSHDIGVHIESIEAAGEKAPLLCTRAAMNLFLNRGEINQLLIDDISNSWFDLDFVIKKLEEHTRDISPDKIDEIMNSMKYCILPGADKHEKFHLFPILEQIIININANGLYDTIGYKFTKFGYHAKNALNAKISYEVILYALLNAWIKTGAYTAERAKNLLNELILLECDILHNLEYAKPQIILFKDNPLYEDGFDFFEKALSMNENKAANEIRLLKSKAFLTNLRVLIKWLDAPSLDDAGDSDTKPEPVRVDKIGRNEQCPCGSGKKYKKCCG